MSALFAVGTLLAFAVLADIAPPAAQTVPSPEPAAKCSADSDCVAVTSGGCCGTCCPVPVATSKAEKEAQHRRCAAVDCSMPRCENVDCAKSRSLEVVVAVCKRNRCVLEDVPSTPQPQLGTDCRANSDCRVIYPGPGPDAACRSSPCGCCPGTEPQAVPARPPKAEPEKMQPPRAEPPPSPEKTTPADRPQRPPVACSPCPGPSRTAHAVCRQGRCMLAKEPAQ